MERNNDNEKPNTGRLARKHKPVSLFRRLLKIAAILLILLVLLIMAVPWFVPVLVEWKINEIL